ncbi:MAG: DUF1549 and DUF1553 domain-containing protein [Isosphaeraceae bacterium]
MPRSGFTRPALALLFIAIPAVAQEPEPVREPTWTAEQKGHWAYQKPVRHQVPRVDRPGWDRNPIDGFLLDAMNGVGIEPAPTADRRTLIRRVTFDLTGLPPTPEEVAVFEADTRADAYEKLVDRLIASPRYGERFARFWLDLARFAESDGFKSDKARPNAWRYRDWVVNALNRDLPYDQFVRMQLAGDEIAPGDPEAFTATAFNRHFPFEDNNMIPGLNRQLMLDDMTDTTTSVFLGLTVACARCHDHKYDPISQKDYYRLQAIFAGVKPRDNYTIADDFDRAQQEFIEAEYAERVAEIQAQLDALEGPHRDRILAERQAKLDPEALEAIRTPPEKRTATQDDLVRIYGPKMKVAAKQMQAVIPAADRTAWEGMTKRMEAIQKATPPPLPSTLGMVDNGPEAPPLHLMQKGNFKRPGEMVAPGFLSVICPEPESIDASPTATTTGRRLALANWIASPDHPLTARVAVNRLWQWHFGRGIVATSSDFGNQGVAPSHPELLDWLATELVRQGWSMKAMHRLMVTSEAYKQSSVASPETVENDPDNALFSRYNRRRLEAEAVRDSMLQVAGLLDTRVGGPSVFPDLPPGVETRDGWVRSPKAEDRNRRSIYVFVRRNLKYPLFDAFDSPDTNLTCPERNVSVNAPQALMLLNSDLALDHARHLAGRVLKGLNDDSSDTRKQVERAWSLALNRRPTEPETQEAIDFLNQQAGRLSPSVAAKDLPTPMPEAISPVQAAALVDLCHALLNLNEFVFID